MRLLMVSQRMPPYRNAGAERQALLLARTLRRLGLNVSVLTTRYERGLPGREIVDSVPVDRVPTIPGPALKATQFAYAAATIARRAPEVDLIHGHCLSAAVLGAVAGKIAHKTPILVKPSTGPPNGEIEKLESSYIRPLWRRLAQHVSGWAVLTEDIQQELLQIDIDPDRCHAVDNGVDCEHFRPAAGDEKLQLRKKLGLPDGPGAIFAGRLTYKKGLQTLINAWSQVQAQAPNAWLAIAGAGPLRQVAAETAHRFHGSVFFPGEIPDIAAWLRAADLFVLPTSGEGHSNAILEGLATGLPVVTTQFGAQRYSGLIREAFTLVEHENTGQVADTLIRLINNSGERNQRAAAAREHACSFAIERIAADYISIYEKMLRGV